ncbi:MAG TPA: anthranilate phosphoribosyltransferase [Polyangiaceae bacterium]
MTSSSPTFAETLKAIESTEGLSAVLARRAFDAVLSGTWTQAQIAGFLIALRSRGESAEVIVAAAESMRATMVRVQHSFELVMDTCGTGGDGHGTINLSTAAAIVLAASGVVVAKHGNRAVSSRAGSADVLEALGIALGLEAATTGDVLNEVGITFMLAPSHHPAMRHAMPVRRDLGVRTIFNCLGPLANPAGATHQLIGAFSDAIRPVMAETLRHLGTKRAWVVFGSDGLDEVSPFTSTHVSETGPHGVTSFEIAPEDFGIARSPAGAIAGGDRVENARALTAIFDNQPHPAVDAVVLNAAAGFVVAEELSPKAAAAKAREVIASGAALHKLSDWVRVSCAAKAKTAT